MKTDNEYEIIGVTPQDLVTFFGGELSEDGTIWTAPDSNDLGISLNVSLNVYGSRFILRIQGGTELTKEQIDLLKIKGELLL